MMGGSTLTLRPFWGRASMRLSPRMVCMVITICLLACRTLGLVSVRLSAAKLPMHHSTASALASAHASLHPSRCSTPSQLFSFHRDGEYSGRKRSNKRQRRKGWHRVVTRFLRRRQNSDDYSVDDWVETHHAPRPMKMSLQTEQDVTDPPLPFYIDENDTDFVSLIRGGFSSLTPQELMHDLQHQNSTDYILDRIKGTGLDETAVDSVFETSAGVTESPSRDVISPKEPRTVIAPPRSGAKQTTSPPSYPEVAIPDRKNTIRKRRFWARVTQKWFRNFLLGIIHRRSVVPPHGLVVEAHPRGRFGGLASLGQFRCDTTILFDRVIFPNIRLSGGGTLMTKRLLVNLLAFGNNSWSSAPRYERPFEIIATNCTFTEDDLWESSCIRNGLANLLVRILTNAGVSAVQVKVTAVKILPYNKISCSGEATTDFGTGAVVPFEVRSGLGTASRGHILTFPGLEVSLNPVLGFIPIIPDVNLDIGHNARVLHVELDHRRRRATVSASTTITPHHTRRLRDYEQHSDSYFAQFTFDVGRWVTKIGRFGK